MHFICIFCTYKFFLLCMQFKKELSTQQDSKNLIAQNSQYDRIITIVSVYKKFDKDGKLCNNRHNTKLICFIYMEWRIVMTEKKIRLSDTEEVLDFVRAAGKCDFEIDVCYNRAVIDAKSILGMFYIGLCKDLTVKYGGKDTRFERTVRKYAVC